MFEALKDYEDQPSYVLKVRNLEKLLRKRNEKEIETELADFISWLLESNEDTGTTAQINVLATLTEYSQVLRNRVIALHKDVLNICRNAVISGELEESQDYNILIKLVGWMYSGDGMNESDDSSFWIPTILNVMDSDGCTAETGLISGNAAMQILAATYAGQILIEEISQILDKSTNPFSTMCMMKGVYGLGKLDLLLLRPESKEGSSTSKCLLYSRILQILALCTGSSSLTFQNFDLLKIWCKRVKEAGSRSMDLLHTPEEAGLADVEGGSDSLSPDLVNTILKLCQGNFENQMKGVPDLCRDIYRLLLECVSEVWRPETASNFLDALLRDVMTTRWSQKSKYIQLAILVPLVGREVATATYPGIGEGLAISLSANHLTHAGVDVMKLYLESEKIWEKEISRVLCSSLLSSDPITRQNSRDHWLNVTLKKLPHSHQILTRHLDEQGMSSSVSSEILLAKLDILRICRRIGTVDTLSEPAAEALKAGLVHPGSDVRGAAFAVLCEVKKRGTRPSRCEMDAVCMFLDQNAGDDCPRLRQTILSQFCHLMIRCRDYAANQMRRLEKQRDLLNKGNKEQEKEERERLNQIETDLLEVATFLDKLIVMLMWNLFPGGNYQRRILTLNLVNLFIDNFVVFNAAGMNKCSGNGNPEEFITFAHKHNLIRFRENQQLFRFLLDAAEDNMSDIRELAGHILKLFNPDPDQVQHIQSRALMMLRSPKDGTCETGATLLQLVSAWSTLQPGLEENGMCSRLLDKYIRLLEQSEVDFLGTVTSDPMFGTIIALRGLLFSPESPHRLSFNQRQLDRLVSCMESSTHTMLSLLSGREEGSHNPDFQEMARAINNIIGLSESGTEEPGVPQSQQLVISAVWHNIKVCALLVAELVSCSPLDPDPSPDSPALTLSCVNRCGDILIRILTLCRHKGALEGTVEGCTSYTRRLINSQMPGYRDIPGNMLQDVLKYIRSGSNSSVTRRSAGLPGLVQTIVAAEAGSNSGKLLKIAVSELVCLAQHSVQAETRDTTTGHALHILRGVVQDTAVSRHIGPYIKDIVATCLNSFECESWVDRNAALQLFGALTPRILGQKKLRTDASYNKVNLEEVDTRFPGLLSLFVNQLNKPETIRSNIVSASVVPILTVLSRLERPAVGQSLQGQGVGQISSRISDCMLPLLGSPVIQVRQLAGRVYAEFSSFQFSDVLVKAEEVVKRETGRNSNLLHGYMLVLKELSSRKVEVGDEIVAKLLCISRYPCYLIKHTVLGIQTNLQLTKCVAAAHPFTGDNYHPGFYQLQDEVGGCVGGTEAEEEVAERLLTLLSDSDVPDEQIISALKNVLNLADKSKVYKEMDILLERLDSTDSRIAGLTLRLLTDPQLVEVLSTEPELALDILEKCKEEPQPDHLGQSSGLLMVKLRAVCLNSLLIQDDWAWFFGDTSEYVSVFVETSEFILGAAHPTEVEDSRLNAASCLQHLAPCLKIRKIRGSMTPILQYGVINLANAALILLQDEDTEVRNAASKFSSLLTRSSLLQDGGDLNVHQAIENVIYYGLEHLTDVQEMFTPVLKLFDLTSLSYSYSAEDTSELSRSLFKKGDGVNIYEEITFFKTTCASCLRKQAAVENLEIRFEVPELIERANQILDQIEEEEKQTSGLISYQGLEILLDLAHAAHLAILPNVLRDPVPQMMEENLKRILERVHLKIPNKMESAT